MSPKDKKCKLIGLLLQACVAASIVDSQAVLASAWTCSGQKPCASTTHILGVHLTGNSMILVASSSTVMFKGFAVLLWQNYGPNMQLYKVAHSTARNDCEDQRQVPACRASPCQEECSQF